ncbi:hypothetical protein PG993_008870 [Apiospora rasikravindrae]|uniref:Uncharacterized protein n=1 Tax=Apiospora rasikravindrae TaxID=990691 RepID=A0ABR1SPJ7_9PEZI
MSDNPGNAAQNNEGAASPSLPIATPNTAAGTSPSMVVPPALTNPPPTGPITVPSAVSSASANVQQGAPSSQAGVNGETTPLVSIPSSVTPGPTGLNELPPSIPTGTVTSGTAAGAAVGSFIGGLLIGLAVLLLMFRRRREIDPFLLDAASDKQLAKDYQNIYKLLQQHVVNFYHHQPVVADVEALKQAMQRLELAHNDAFQLDGLLSLALEQRTRAAALQHIISHVLVNSIDFTSPSNLSILPPHVIGFVRSVPAAERGGGNSTAMRKALDRWRILTAYLMQPHRSHRLPLVPSEEVAEPQTELLTSALIEFLGPFICADEMSQTKQKSHLQAIAYECAKLGYVLLSQPCEWQFVYSFSGQGKGTHSLVLHPGLQKMGGRAGEKYGVQKLVEAPVVAKI